MKYYTKLSDFYNGDETKKSYADFIITPITDFAKLKRKFVLIEGNAEQLNEELQEEFKGQE